jgi:hypothetical protein
MPTIIPQGENVRRAVKWISEERQGPTAKKLSQLIEEAAVKFNLSPAETEYLARFFVEQKG